MRRLKIRLAAGDLTIPAYDPKTFPDKLRSEVPLYYSARYGAEVVNRNWLLCRPLIVAAAKNECTTACSSYLHNRSIHFDHLPLWGKMYVSETVKSRYESFNPLQAKYNPTLHKRAKAIGKAAQAELKQHVDEFKKVDDADEIIKTLGLKSFNTFPQFNDFTQAADKLLFSDLIIRSRFASQISYFSIANDGPLGIIALKTLKELVPLMLSMQVVSDCMNCFGIDASEKDMLSWAKQYATKAADFFTSRGFKNILSLQSFLHSAEDINLSKQQRQEMFREVFDVKDATVFLERKFFEKALKPNNIASAQNSADLGLKNALKQTLEIYSDIKPIERKEWARKLCGAIKKTSLTYEQVLENLQNGIGVEEIYSQAFFEVLQSQNVKSPELNDQASNSESSVSQNGLSNKAKPLVKSYQLELHYDSSNLKFTVGHSAFLLIDRAIQKMKKAQFGHFSYLGDLVFETRLHSLCGYRIYFTFKADTLHILRVGKKKTQQTDIDFSKGLAKQLDSEVH